MELPGGEMVQRWAHQQKQGGLFKEGSRNSIPRKGKVWRDNREVLDPLHGEGSNEWEMWVPGGTEKDTEVGRETGRKKRLEMKGWSKDRCTGYEGGNTA